MVRFDFILDADLNVWLMEVHLTDFLFVLLAAIFVNYFCYSYFSYCSFFFLPHKGIICTNRIE